MLIFRKCARKNGNRGKASSIYLSQWANRTSVKNERRRKTPGNHRNFSFFILFLNCVSENKPGSSIPVPFTAYIAGYDPYLHKNKWRKVFSFLNAEAFLIVL